MDPRSRLTLDEINRALLERLLPETARARQPVLLACDDTALARLSTDLDGDALAAISDALTAEQPVTADGGFEAAVSAAADFARRRRSRPEPPPQLAALCLTVLAASRMDYTADHTAGAYYTHLAAIVDVPMSDQWPHIPHADELIGTFEDLAEWLDDDQGGRRGQLLLPRDPGRRYVGVPVSQTVLRGRDRHLLAEFFWRYRRSLDAGHDAVRLLRGWGGRHQLTGPAQQRIADRHLRSVLGAALVAAYRNWDGTRSDQHGRTVRPAVLRLGVNPTRAAIHATVPAFTIDTILTGPDGRPFTLTAHPQETIVPLDWLAHAVTGPLRLQHSDSETVEVLDSPTMLFEMTDIGLQRVPVASGQPVWALTCDPRLTGLPLPPARVHRQPLPGSWKLLVALAVDELPADLTAPAGRPEHDLQNTNEVRLFGGLSLGDGAWLLDHPPALTADLPEPALLVIDGRQAGDIEGGEIRWLTEIAHEPGVHRLEVGDTWEAEIELADRGPRHGIGTVCWDLGHPALVRHGATGEQHPVGGQGATVTGASVIGGPPLDWHPPVLIRSQATVHAIHSDGTVTAHAPQPPAAWERQAGVDRPSGVWGVEDDGTIVWVCVDHPARPRVIRVRDQAIVQTDDALDVVYQFADAAVAGAGAEDAAARWTALVDAACDDA